LAHPAYAVWGADTDVGKTLVSAGLAAAAVTVRGLGVRYVKPVQTGFPGDTDAGTVAAAAGLRLSAGRHAAELLDGGHAESQPGASVSGTATTLFAWRLAAAPSAAVEAEGRGVSDEEVVAATADALADATPTATPRPTLCLVETAGGPASPGPSGSLQADAWRALRLPPLLVASPRLGGVSATLAAAEALALRGHGPPGAVALVQPAGGLPPGHVAALERHLAALARAAGGAADPGGCAPPRLFVLPPCGPAPPRTDGGAGTTPDPALAAWLAAARPELGALVDDLLARHARRVEGLRSLAPDTAAALWFPFTQHGDGSGLAAGVTTIDARAGEHLLTLSAGGGRGGGGGEGETPEAGRGLATTTTPPATSSSSLTPLYDGCAAWWTQGVAGPAGSPLLPLAVGAAVGRYGHVIHPRAAAAPVLAAAQSLLTGPGAGWAARVFFSDDGSTAVEVGLKMAFRASAGRRESAAKKATTAGGKKPPPLIEATVLAVAGGYHGDTLGAMCATAPSLFNGEAQTPWYAGRGLFLDPPTAGMEGGGAGWVVRGGDGSATPVPGGLAGLFAADRLAGPAAAAYEAAIGAAIDAHEAETEDGDGRSVLPTLSAALFEPVLMGAGGMRLVDPAWHAGFVRAARARGIPVIADEVFTGLWRLGAVSGCALLGVAPDIGCYAKLLTGGAVPLAATLASAEIFEAFTSGGLAGALLHGHSYSAHAAGCAAAAAAAAVVGDPAANPALCAPGRPGCECGEGGGGGGGGKPCPPAGCGRLAPLWDGGLTASLADHPSVARVAAIGTVLAVHLRADTAGYGSDAAAGVAARLRSSGAVGGSGGGGGSGFSSSSSASSASASASASWGVYARPLGDVLYLMLTPTSVPGRDGPRLQRALLDSL
jgi:bifunctional dethiobiotin synthetase / adenosylmethionine---8-amino-7-oxononanoate aminotransferase